MKSYRLKNAIPGIPAGEIFVYCDKIGEYVQKKYYEYILNDGDKSFSYRFKPNIVETGHNWFEEIKEQPEKTEVVCVRFLNSRKNVDVQLNKDLPQNRINLIKYAIEQVLNSEPPVTKEKLYTQSEVDQLTEDYFNAAKDRHWKNQTGTTELYDGEKLPYYPEKYKTVQSYNLSKNSGPFLFQSQNDDERKPLFYVDYGKHPIYEGDTLYVIYEKFRVFPFVAEKEIIKNMRGKRIFSSKKLADEFLDRAFTHIKNAEI